MEDIRQWVAQNKLRAIGAFWATGLAGSLAYQWTRPIPTQLKIIHSRVYAQALTLVALGLAGVADMYEHRRQTSQELEEYRQKLHELENKFGKSSHEADDERHLIENKFGKEAVQES